jgi:hypothetical protein
MKPLVQAPLQYEDETIVASAPKGAARISASIQDIFI